MCNQRVGLIRAWIDELEADSGDSGVELYVFQRFGCSGGRGLGRFRCLE